MARINEPHLTYHVIKRGNNREGVFCEEDDYRHYLNTIQRYKKKCGHLLTVMQSIEQNPLRAGMVARVADYPWHSYRMNIRKKESTILDRKDNIVF